jgi:hypothetical protein
MKFPLRFQSLLLFRRSYKPQRPGSRASGLTFRPARPPAPKAKESPPAVKRDPSVGWPEPQHRWMV